MKRKIVSLFLALCMVLTVFPASVFAAERLPAATEEVQETAAVVEETTAQNEFSVEQLLGEGKIEGSLTRKLVYADKDNGYYTDVEEAIALLREKMVDRRTNIEIPLRVSKAEVAESELGDLIVGIFALAAAHTGVEDQGDYLLWQIGEIAYGYGGYVNDSYYYLDLSYNLSYYTTLEQEVRVERMLDTAIPGFGFTESTDDYTKIKTIYDYICANVTYDYDNLEDDTYTLKHTAYAALEHGKAVCQGYALLLYRMLLAVGVDCRIITGVDEQGGAHGWNIVALDGVYYNLDSTWDSGYDEYRYFLKGSADFPEHYRDAAYELEEFHAAYPMADTAYTGGVPAIPSGTCGDGVTWILAGDGTLTISGSGAMDDYERENAAPWYDYRDSVKNVVVEEGVTRVGNYAFRGYALRSLHLCEGVKEIGREAFKVTNLTGVQFPDSLHSIEWNAFEGNLQLESVTFGNRLNSISGWAFYNCPMITELHIPDSVETMGNGAFSGCSELKKVTIGSGLKVIPSSAFSSCYRLTDLVIGKNVERIEEDAFFQCSDLNRVVLPASLKELDRWIFRNCRNLDTIIFVGDAPQFDKNMLDGMRDYIRLTTVLYPCNNPTWTEDLFQGYGHQSVQWLPNHVCENGVCTLCGEKEITLNGGCGSNVYWTLDVDGVLNVYGRGDILYDPLDTKESLAFTAIIDDGITYISDHTFNRGYKNLKTIIFKGDAPIFGEKVFDGLTATVYYPAGNPTWTKAVRQQYGGNITWVAVCSDHSYENGLCTICGEKDPNFNPDGLKGDADGSGEVDYVDAMIVLQYHTGVVGNDALDLTVCDVDGSGEVDYVDAMMILQYHTGVIGAL